MKASNLKTGEKFKLPDKEGVRMALYKLDREVKCINQDGETEYIDKNLEVMCEEAWPYNMHEEELCRS